MWGQEMHCKRLKQEPFSSIYFTLSRAITFKYLNKVLNLAKQQERHLWQSLKKEEEERNHLLE